MIKKLVAVAVIFIGVGALLADEAKGKFKKAEKGGLITVEVDGKDVEYKLSKESKVYDGDSEVKGKERGKLFKELKEGTEIKVVYDKDGDKITVKELRIKK
jgi:hypothetical protein